MGIWVHAVPYSPGMVWASGYETSQSTRREASMLIISHVRSLGVAIYDHAICSYELFITALATKYN